MSKAKTFEPGDVVRVGRKAREWRVVHVSDHTAQIEAEATDADPFEVTFEAFENLNAVKGDEGTQDPE